MILGWVALALALPPFALALWNLSLFRVPALAATPPPVSVLIPARNEEGNIGEAVRAVLASEGVELEVVVLDDGSTDGTAAVLAAIDDRRLRVASGGGLPAGWSGKQFACARLAELAQHELMVFTDADVRLAPDALSRMAGFMQRGDVALASGFPRQVVVTWSEQLLLPLIHFLLLGYLPFAQMRRSPSPALGAGCGQLFITWRAAYRQAGGHGAIRASLHDGLTLPRAYRRAGLKTDLFDATPFAQCRMYADAAQLWEGLTKNATEGMASPVALPVWTVILGGGQVLPTVLMLLAPSTAAMLAQVLAIGLRLVLAARFRQPEVSAVLHPVGVLGVLVVQWASLLRRLRGGPQDLARARLPGGMTGWLLLLALAASPAAAAPGVVEVTVTGVRNGRGEVLVAVCDRAAFLAPSCPYQGRAPARAGSVSVRVAGVPGGTYAVQAFHDENGNGKLDRNLFGVPTEGMGFSRDAPMRFGPPAFADAAVAFPDAGASVSFALRYF